MRSSLLLVALVGVLGCKPKEVEDTSIIGVPPRGPELSHQPPEGALQDGDTVVLTVEADDEDGVAQVVLWQRVPGAPSYESVELVPAGGDTWQGELTVRAPGLEYWFRGVDLSPYAAESALPANAGSDPFELPVTVKGLIPPYAEDVEGASSVFSLGLGVASEGFPGYGWRLDSEFAASGTSSLLHPSAAAGGTPLDDWLILPALDLRGLEGVELTFQERGSGIEAASHEVWVSTGSALPADGEFERLLGLSPPPEGAWGRGDLVDLSAYAEQPVVWVALRATGRTDQWWVDDLAVGELGLDLVLSRWSAEASTPGGESAVSVTLRNRGGDSAGPVSAEGQIDPLDGSFSGPVVLGPMLAGASVDGVLTLSLTPEVPDDAPLPFMLFAGDGLRSFQFPLDVVVGDPPRAELAWTVPSTSVVELFVGSGDPALPNFESRVLASVDAAGPHAAVLDLTAYGAYWPPSAGPDRWYVRMASTAGGTLDEVTLRGSGTAFSLAEPAEVGEDAPATVYLPGRPVPTLSESVISPALAPGQASEWSFTLSNEGVLTSGLTQVSLVSDDPDLIVTGEAVALGEDWGAPASVEVGLSVASTHLDGTPLSLSLVLEDELESLVFPLSLALPWPRLVVAEAQVNEGPGGDGRLDVGEEAQLELTLRNVGTAATAGVLACTLSGDAGGQVQVVQATSWLAPVGVGGSRVEDDWVVRAVSGQTGDVLSLSLSCGEGPTRTVAPVTLTLGALGERPLGGVIDAVGDGQDPSGPDLLSLSARVDSATDTLLLRATHTGPVVPDGLLVELTFVSPGAPYDLFQASLVGGAGTLRGRGTYGVWADLGAVQGEWLSPELFELAVPLSGAGLVQPSVSLGLGVGFCGGVLLYCDQIPDGFGSVAQDTLDTSGLLRFSW